jgi:phytoene dehydrogenase-like protein
MALLLLNRVTNYRLLIGGSHRIASVVNKIINENGGQVRTSVLIRRIIVENGRAVGVETDDGIIYQADKAVVSSLDPRTTFSRLLDQKILNKDFTQKIDDWKWEKWSLLTLHLALQGRPQFAAARNNPDVDRALVYVLGYETVNDLLKHWKAIEKGELLPGAGFNCCFPSIHDPSQAVEGRTSGLVSQMTPYRLKGDAQKWYDRNIREEQTEQCLTTLEKYAPGIKKQVLWPFVTTPIDIENKLNDMVEGSIKQGAYRWFQMGYNRPNDECSNHRTPVEGLYLCGSCTYPGGLVTFGPGYLASNRIAEDAGFPKWWKEPDFIADARQKGLL